MTFCSNFVLQWCVDAPGATILLNFGAEQVAIIIIIIIKHESHFATTKISITRIRFSKLSKILGCSSYIWISWGNSSIHVATTHRMTQRCGKLHTLFPYKKSISQQPFIRVFFLFFFLLNLIERYLSPLFNEVIFRFKKKSFILAFLPKRYPSLYFSLCNLVIFSREYWRKWRKIYVTRQR